MGYIAMVCNIFVISIQIGPLLRHIVYRMACFVILELKFCIGGVETLEQRCTLG